MSATLQPAPRDVATGADVHPPGYDRTSHDNEVVLSLLGACPEFIDEFDLDDGPHIQFGFVGTAMSERRLVPEVEQRVFAWINQKALSGPEYAELVQIEIFEALAGSEETTAFAKANLTGSVLEWFEAFLRVYQPLWMSR